MNRRKQFSRGFTLIEMIVVITIIGILASVVVINAPRFIGRANITKAQQEINTIETSADTFKWEYHRYPETIEEMLNPPELPGQPTPEPFIDERLVDPWGNDYYYSIEEGKPVVICFGEDGQEGTEDDITNEKRTEDSEF